jgi:hypothetical protein
MSEKRRNSAHKVRQVAKKRIRKLDTAMNAKLSEQRLKNNLNQMVASISGNKKVEKFTTIARELSTAAKLSNGRVWSWNYVASVHSGSIKPGKKFIKSLAMCAQRNNRCKQWFYFVCRRSVAAIYNKSIMAEIIKTNMQNMGYRQVTFSRYMEVKRKAVNHSHGTH